MSVTSDLLFSYLRDVLYDTANAKLDLGKLEEDYAMFARGLMYFATCFSQYNEFANALARGDLSVAAPPPENELAAPLKTLHASLRHLTWQSQQVAKGDYKQRVDFMGEFADAFNTMIEQLSERQERLENEIITSRKHAEALAQGNLLLSELTRYIPEQIFVVSSESHEILHTNDLANLEIEKDPDYITELMKLLCGDGPLHGSLCFDIQLTRDNVDRYLAINTYQIEWYGAHAAALVINDVSAEKRQMKELEDFAYRDALTNSYNRFYGMLALNEWLDKKKVFSLIFVDLDNLKYVNDKYGHNEGDAYITNISKHLQSYSGDTVVCRIGGDEYMLLVPGEGFDEAAARMEDLQNAIQGDEYLYGKDYTYSISFGIIAIDETNDLSSSDVLSIADERMYEHKRARKKERQSSV